MKWKLRYHQKQCFTLLTVARAAVAHIKCIPVTLKNSATPANDSTTHAAPWRLECQKPLTGQQALLTTQDLWRKPAEKTASSADRLLNYISHCLTANKPSEIKPYSLGTLMMLMSQLQSWVCLLCWWSLLCKGRKHFTSWTWPLGEVWHNVIKKRKKWQSTQPFQSCVFKEIDSRSKNTI